MVGEVAGGGDLAMQNVRNGWNADIDGGTVDDQSGSESCLQKLLSILRSEPSTEVTRTPSQKPMLLMP
jgi:hypothetical protein